MARNNYVYNIHVFIYILCKKLMGMKIVAIYYSTIRWDTRWTKSGGKFADILQFTGFDCNTLLLADTY